MFRNNLGTSTIEQQGSDGNWYPAPAITLFEEIQKLQGEIAANRSAVWSKENELKNWFVQSVMEYHDGCSEGKISFLESLDLEDYLPSHELEVTFKIDVGYASDDRQSDIEYEIQNILENRLDHAPHYVNFDWS